MSVTLGHRTGLLLNGQTAKRYVNRWLIKVPEHTAGENGTHDYTMWSNKQVGHPRPRHLSVSVSVSGSGSFSVSVSRSLFLSLSLSLSFSLSL